MNGQYSLTVINQFHEFSWILSTKRRRGGSQGSLPRLTWRELRGVETLQRCDNQGLSSEVDRQTLWKDMMYLEFIIDDDDDDEEENEDTHILYNEEFTEWFQAANVCFVVTADISKAFWDAHLAAMLARACDADSSILVLHQHSDPSWRRSTFQPRLVIFFSRFFGFPFQPVRSYLQPNNLDGNAKLAWLGWSLHSVAGTLLKLHK